MRKIKHVVCHAIREETNNGLHRNAGRADGSKRASGPLVLGLHYCIDSDRSSREINEANDLPHWLQTCLRPSARHCVIGSKASCTGSLPHQRLDGTPCSDRYRWPLQKFESQVMKIQIISLQSATARREAISQQMEKQALPWAFFDACDGTKQIGPPYVAEDAFRARGRTLVKGEIGCYQSHWALWEMLANSDDKWWMILEDDHLLDPAFDVRSLVDAADQMTVNYVRLASIFLQKFAVLGMFKGRQIVRFKSGPYGAGAYLISQTGARLLLASINAMLRPVDDEMDRFWANGIPAIAVFPAPTLNTGLAVSTISANDSRGLALKTRRNRLSWLRVRVIRKMQKTIGNIKLMSFDRQCRRISKTFPE